MRHSSMNGFLQQAKSRAGQPALAGPMAVILAEDEIELVSTITHHQKAGFRSVVLLAPAEFALDPSIEAQIHRIDYNVFVEDALMHAVNRIQDALPAGSWLFYCYNAEYLFFPFSENRSVRELLAFHGEERRQAMLSYVIDLYAPDLQRHGNAVSLAEAHLDRQGYYALARQDGGKDWQAKPRQMDFFGGLRWRFEEHIPWAKRKIDRISLFQSAKGLRLQPDFTFSDEEYNTYACPWHNNLTAAICSFRTAKALRSNPGSRAAIHSFHLHNSMPFSWQSQQLLDLGLIEPGQWF